MNPITIYVVQIFFRTNYGTTRMHPGNKAAQAFADFAGVRTFTNDQVRTIQELGFTIEYVSDPAMPRKCAHLGPRIPLIQHERPTCTLAAGHEGEHQARVGPVGPRGHILQWSQE